MRGELIEIPEGGVVLFDGVCSFCDGTVRFIIDRDPEGRFAFASLQSETGRRLTAELRRDPNQISTIVLVEPRRASIKSTAVLRILRRLDWPWPVFYAGVLVPRVLRDAVYDAFARRRYRLFGRLDSCRVPPPEIRRRFVDREVTDAR